VKFLVTGAHGLLGQKLALVIAQEASHRILLTDLAATTFFKNARFDYEQLDITARADVKSLVLQYRPDVIVNTAAMTDVDACETEREAAWRANVDGLKHLLIAARRLEGCHVVQVSTDYVFDGRSAPYAEHSRPSPVSYYGRSKLAAENALLASGVSGTVVRTQVLYGTGFKVRRNFVAWVLSMLETKKTFRVVDDQIGNPTIADDLAWAILRLAERRAGGLYHVSGPEAIDRYRFARAIARTFDFDAELIAPIRTAELGQAASRPMNSTFVTLKFESEFHTRLSDVRAGLARLYQQYRDGADHLDVLDAFMS
jgi:dTDP-4-dehydrorhamnose reductase